MIPSPVSINLLEWLTELRKTVYFLDYSFIIKGYNSGTSRWKRCMGQDMGERGGHRASILSGNNSPRNSTRLPTRNPVLLAFLQGSLHRYIWLNYWPKVIKLNLYLLSPPWRSGGQPESSSPLILVGFSGKQPPSLSNLGAFQKSPH